MTTKEANDTRKGLVGKLAYIAWRRYMEGQENDDLSIDNLRAWDARKNYGALRDSFGSDEDLVEIGVKHKFYSFINQYSSLKIVAGDNVSKVSFSMVRTGPDGKRQSIENADDEAIQFQISRLKMEVKGTAARLRAFEYEWDAIRNLVSGWLFEMEQE